MRNEAPLFVLDPQSGEQLNVGSLAEALHQFDVPPNSSLCMGARDAIHRIIKILNLTVHDPAVTNPVDLANVYRDLHALDELFAGMQNSSPNPALPVTAGNLLEAVGQN